MTNTTAMNAAPHDHSLPPPMPVPVLVLLPPQLAVFQPDRLNAAAQAVANALAQSLDLPADLASQLAVTIAPNPAAMGFFHSSSSTHSSSATAPQPKSQPMIPSPPPPPRSAHHQRVTIDNTYESLNRARNTFYVNMKHMRPSVTADLLLDFFTHICPPSLVHIHYPDRPSKFPGRKVVLVFTDKYDADAFYHQLTLRVETGELDEAFALTQDDMDFWAGKHPHLAGDDPSGYKRVPLRLDVSRHTMPVPQPIVGPNAAPVSSMASTSAASGAGGWVGVESWRPSRARRIDEPLKVVRWRTRHTRQQEELDEAEAEESDGSQDQEGNPVGLGHGHDEAEEEAEEEEEEEDDRGGWQQVRPRRMYH